MKKTYCFPDAQNCKVGDMGEGQILFSGRTVSGKVISVGPEGKGAIIEVEEG
jgi:hypothetical protein